MAIIYSKGNEVSVSLDGTKTPRPTYDNRVVATFTRSEQIMSDIWEDVRHVIVWDDLTASVKDVWGDNAVIDAPADIIAKATDWKIDDLLQLRKLDFAREVDAAKAKAQSIARDKMLRVVSGRKIAKGIEAQCFWYGETKWGFSVGLQMADGSRQFTSANNVEVINPERYERLPQEPDWTEVRAELAVNFARYQNWDARRAGWR